MRKAVNRIYASITITALVMLSLFGLATAGITTAAAAPRAKAVANTASQSSGRGAVAGAKIKPVKVHGKWRKRGWAHRMTKPVTKTATYHLYMHTRHHHHATTVSNKVSKAAMAKASKKMKAAAQPFTSAPGADLSFDGLDSNFNNADPLNFGDNWAPNPSADVSPDYYVQTVDYSMGVFDKNGNLVGAQELEDLFSNSGTTSTGTACDYDVDDSLLQSANVVYDSQTDRWIIGAVEWSDPNFETGPQYECLAVSTSGNPMGSYNLYPIQLVGSGNVEIDAQDIGLWGTGVYLTGDRSCDETNIAVPPCPTGTVTSTATNGDLVGDLSSQVWAFNTSDLESGSALRWQTTTGIANTCTGTQVGKCGTMDAQELYGWLAATQQAQTGLPPANAPEYFMTQDDNVNNTTSAQYQNFVRWTVDWNTPANSLIVGGNKVLSASLTSNVVTVNFSSADNYVAGDSFVIEGVTGNINGVCTNAVIVTSTQLTCSKTGTNTSLTTPGAATGGIRLALQPAANYAYHYDSNIGGDFQEPSPGNGVFANYNQAIPRLRYANFGGTEQLWWSETTATGANNSAPGRASWFRVDINSTTRAVNNGASSYYTTDSTNRFYPSSAVDKNGDLLMGYNVASTSVYPGLRYAGRLAGDAIGAAGASANTTQTETTLINGTSYLFGTDPDDGGDIGGNGPIDAFGGNTLMALDPDGCHFWFTGEYLTTPVPTQSDGSDNTWNTRVGVIHYPSCTPSTLNTSLTTSGVSGSPGTLTATLTSTSTNSGVGGKTISFTLDGNTPTCSPACPGGTAVTNDYGVASLTGVDTTADSPGNNPNAVSASFAAGGEYQAASATGDLNKNTDQTITFPALAGMTIGDAAQTLSATASSGNPVTYTASPGSICTISGGTNVSVAGGAGGPNVGPGDKGTCTVTAHQAGDVTYNPAPDVSQTLLVVGQPQTVMITGSWSTTNQAVGVDFIAMATSSTGLPVGFTTDGVNCDVDGGTLGQNILPSHTGTCTVNATQIGNDTYAPATTTVGVPVTIQASQTCSFSGMGSSVAVGASTNAAVSCTSGLNASGYTVTNSGQTVATVAANDTRTIAAAAGPPATIQPSNSFSITAGVSGGSGSSRTETVTCASCGAGSSIVVGNTVVIAGNATANYNRTAVVTAKTSTTITVGSGSTNVGTWAAGGTPTIAISGASESGSTVTLNTTTAHGLLTGGAINVAGVTPSGYNGSFTIASTPLGQGAAQATAATLTYTDATTGLGNSTVAGTVGAAGSGATESGNTVTLTTTTAHTYAPGATITVSGVGVAGYNGTFTAIVPTSGTTVTYTDGTSGLADSGGGSASSSGTGASESGNTVTLNTTAAHGLAPGATITVTGVGVAGYNGTFTTIAPTSGTVITYTDATAGLAPSGAGSIANNAVAACTTGGSPGAETVLGLHVGTCTVTATQSGNADYSAAAPVSKTFSVTIGSQTIGFSPTASQQFVPPFVETATLSPALAGTYGLNPGMITSTTPLVCTVSSTTNGTGTSMVTVTPVSVGTCTLSAAGNAGNSDFNARSATNQNITITKGNQTITGFGPIADHNFGDADFAVNGGVSATSGDPVSFTATGNCTVTPDGSTVHLTAAGSCTITAHQAGDANYNAAPDVAQTFTINPQGNTITFAPLANKTFNDPNFSISATASSGLPVNFTSSTPSVCTIVAGPKVHIMAGGTCTIVAHQPGNMNYDPAPDVSRSFTVNPHSTTTKLSIKPKKVASGGSVTFTATVKGGGVPPAGLTVQFKADGTTVVATAVTNASGVAKITVNIGLGLGSHQIRAITTGNANFTGSTSAAVTLKVHA